jgi:penicillin amidase
VLRDSSGFTVRDFERLQNDDYSLLANALAPLLVKGARRAGAGGRPEVAALAGWNHEMSKDQYAPLVFEIWSAAAWRVFAQAYPPGARELLRARPDWRALLAAFTVGPHRDSLALQSLDSASATIRRLIGSDEPTHSWGELHVVQLQHPIAPAFDLPPIPRSGDANTVMATGGANYRQTAGASYREIIDLGNFDNSVAINVPGQSAQPESEHYADLYRPWANGEYFPLVYSRARVEAETQHVLWLEPRR